MATFEREKFKKIRFLIKVRSSFRGKRKRELLTFLFFIFISSFFWVINFLKEPVEVDLLLPVRIVNVPRDILVTSELPKHIRVKIKDKGAVAFSYKFRHVMPSCDLDYGDMAQSKGSVFIKSDQIAEQLHNIFATSVQIISYTPDAFSISFSRGESKKVPVYLVKSIQTAASYGFNGKISCNPTHVTVYGPAAKLAEITGVYTLPLLLRNEKDTVSGNISLEKIEGVRILPGQIKVVIPIEPFTEKRIEVPIEGVGVPSGFTMRLFPAKATVICYVAVSNYNLVKASDFKLAVDFLQIDPSQDVKHSVRLMKWPAYVSKVRFQPGEAEVLMEEMHE